MSNIPWKTFTTEKDGVKLEVTWWSHDFTAKYKVGDITLRYGLHIMAMCPKKYSEEWLRNDFEKKGCTQVLRKPEKSFPISQFSLRQQKRSLQSQRKKLWSIIIFANQSQMI